MTKIPTRSAHYLFILCTLRISNMKRKLRIVFDVMETGLELQFDIFPRKHEKHKLKTILFWGAGLMYLRVQVRIQTYSPTLLTDTFRGVFQYSKKILR